MNKIISGVFTLAILLSSHAMAADLTTKAPLLKAPAESAYYWKGFYLGAHAGYGSSDKCWSGFLNANTPYDEGCHKASGFIGGGQAGYNWQLGAWVFGVEVQGDWGRLSGSKVSNTFQNFTNRSEINALGLFTGRAGYAWGNTLLYVKGGGAVAQEQFELRTTNTNLPIAVGNETRWGWTVGAGLEHRFAPTWSAAVEYNYVDFGTRFSQLTSVANQFVTSRQIAQDVHLVTARINVHLDGAR